MHNPTEIKSIDCPIKGSFEYNEVNVFSKEVEIILQTILDIEFEAALSLLDPPSQYFEMPVNFPNDSAAIGMFANQKVALIQANPYANGEVETAIAAFPKAKYIISTGICYSSDKTKQIGDIFVSVPKYSGNTKPEIDKFEEMFHNILDEDKFKFQVSYSGRVSKASYTDSYSAIINCQEDRDKVQDAALKSEGKGGELLPLMENKKINGVIVVKGIIDNDIESQITDLNWNYTAALAALYYTQSKMYEYEQSEGNNNIPNCVVLSFIIRL